MHSALSPNYTSYLFSGEERDGRDTVGVLVAFCYGHLFEKIHLLLAGEEDDFGVTKHHDGVCQLIAEQPRLIKNTKSCSQSFASTHPEVMRTLCTDSYFNYNQFIRIRVIVLRTYGVGKCHYLPLLHCTM